MLVDCLGVFVLERQKGDRVVTRVVLFPGIVQTRGSMGNGSRSRVLQHDPGQVDVVLCPVVVGRLNAH
jgi:hypothetical protein